MIAAKGAPEAILDLCQLTTARAQIISQHVAGMADEGLRVLGVARGQPQMQSLFHFSPLPLKHILISLAAGAGSIAWFELFKAFHNHRRGGLVPRVIIS